MLKMVLPSLHLTRMVPLVRLARLHAVSCGDLKPSVAEVYSLEASGVSRHGRLPRLRDAQMLVRFLKMVALKEVSILRRRMSSSIILERKRYSGYLPKALLSLLSKHVIVSHANDRKDGDVSSLGTIALSHSPRITTVFQKRRR